MRYKQFLYALCGTFFFFHAHSQDTWAAKADADTAHIQSAVGFSILGKGYAVGGVDCYGNYTRQCLEYDPATDAWRKMADYPGNGVYGGATGFAIQNAGYIISGRINQSTGMSNEVWQFNPVANQWTKKMSFPGAARCYAFSFVIGNNGYVGTGYDPGFNPIKDFWQYSPGTDSWTQKADFGGGIRTQAFAFSAGTKGYAGCGYNNGMPNINPDVWEYNPATNIWTQKANYGGGIGSQKTALGLCNKGYVCCGVGGGTGLYEYEPLTDVWTNKTNIGGSYRASAFGFVINSQGYVGGGSDPNLPTCLRDFWQYTSDASSCTYTGIRAYAGQKLSISPNPFSQQVTISAATAFEKAEFSIFNAAGRLVKQMKNVSGASLIIERDDLDAGVYIVQWKDQAGVSGTDKLLVAD